VVIYLVPGTGKRLSCHLHISEMVLKELFVKFFFCFFAIVNSFLATYICWLWDTWNFHILSDKQHFFTLSNFQIVYPEFTKTVVLLL